MKVVEYLVRKPLLAESKPTTVLLLHISHVAFRERFVARVIDKRCQLVGEDILLLQVEGIRIGVIELGIDELLHVNFQKVLESKELLVLPVLVNHCE
jgi:hypothetical protein